VKIRSQTAVFFAPLFLVFVLANGLYYVSGKNEELHWGLTESMQATSVTIRTVLEERGRLKGVSALSNLFGVVGSREEKNRFLTGVQVREKTEKNVLLRWCASTNLEPFLSLTDCSGGIAGTIETRSFDEGQRLVSRLCESGDSLEIVALFDTTDAYRSVDAALMGVVAFSGVSVVLSLLISGFIASRISRPVIQMARIASGMSMMETRPESIAQTRIKEFDDLAGTLETVQSVVVDTVRSTQRKLVENEQTRDLTAVHRFMSKSLASSRTERVCVGGVTYIVGMCFPGGGHAGQFFGLESGWVYCGSLKTRISDNPEITAFSLSEVIQEMLSHADDPMPHLEVISKMYVPEYLCLVRLSDSSIRLVRFENGNMNNQELALDPSKVMTIVAPEKMSGVVDDVTEVSLQRGVEGVIEDCSAVFSDMPELCVMSISISTS